MITGTQNAGRFVTVNSEAANGNTLDHLEKLISRENSIKAWRLPGGG